MISCQSVRAGAQQLLADLPTDRRPFDVRAEVPPHPVADLGDDVVPLRVLGVAGRLVDHQDGPVGDHPRHDGEVLGEQPWLPDHQQLGADLFALAGQIGLAVAQAAGDPGLERPGVLEMR
jgi:hypothetical protein